MKLGIIQCDFCMQSLLFRSLSLTQKFIMYVCTVCVLLFASSGPEPTRLLCSWNFPGKNTGVGCHFLLQKINKTQFFVSGEGDGTPLQYSCLENPKDSGAWQAAVHAVAQSRTGLSGFTFTFHFHALEKEMETHSSVLAWRIPGTGESGGLPSMGLHRVGHD